MGFAFQFTPAGIKPLDATEPSELSMFEDAPPPAVDASPQVAAIVRKSTPPAAPVVAKAAPVTTKPVDIVKLAKRRIRELKKAIRERKGLETELARLERLVWAADAKTPAVVRDIKRAAG